MSHEVSHKVQRTRATDASASPPADRPEPKAAVLKAAVLNAAADARKNSGSEPSVDHSVDALLLALRAAEPHPGLEERVLQRLTAKPLPQRGFRLSLALRWAAVPALAACALAIGLAHRQTTHPDARESETAQNTQTVYRALQAGADLRTNSGFDRSIPPIPRIPVRSAPPANTSSQMERSRSGKQNAIASTARKVDRNAGTGRDDRVSFPAPEMPLTEQERLLLRLAHTDDPVQIAMLDPRERAAARLREREEVSRFFASPPLPPELQQEINDALRKQYVNTPPPANLKTATPDRSTP